MNNLQSIWEKTREILKNEISSVSYSNYIEDLIPLYIKDDKIFLKADSSAAQKILTLKYKTLIKSIIFELMEKEYDVVFVLDEHDVLEESPVKVNPYAQTLNKSYTFENFVKGKNNEFAYASALSVAELPGQENSNPLFIYGGPGLGKTHLMHAIGNFILSEDSSMHIMYVTSETFTNDFINSIQAKNQQAFRDKYRKCDLLLIDDIQFLSNKKETLEEFFHTFNDIKGNGKQVVISSDRAPREIRDLDERIFSRFVGGLLVDVSRPDYETRVAILQKKIEHENLVVPPDVIHYIAEVIQTNIRELEGSLKRVIAYSKLNSCSITLAMTKESFKGIYDESKPTLITPKRIKEVVCEYMSINMNELLSSRRNKNIVFPRQISMYLIRTLTNMSYPQIADEEFGGMNHTTIMHNVDKITEEIKINNNTKIIVKDIINILNT